MQTLLGFVWLYANAQRSEKVQLFEGLGIGAVDGSFIAIQQVEARAVGEALERAGEAILGFGYAFNVGKKAIDVIDAGQNFVGEEVGFDNFSNGGCRDFGCVCKLLKMERETGLEPATSSLGKWAMFCFQ